MWDNHYYKDHAVTWSGRCADGLASGTGTLTWVRGSKENWHSGLLQNGRKQGSWVERDADGSRNTYEGPYVDGKEHGPWVDAEGRTIIRYINGLRSRSGALLT